MSRWLPLLFLPGCIDWSSLYQGRCGNGRVEAGEECDDGNRSDTDACLSTCKWATCGDGHVRAGVEDCDDGNLIEGDGCTSKCLLCKSGDANFSFSEIGHCYSRHDEMVTWEGAETTCDARSGYLATFVSSHEAIAVEAALLGTTASSTWIGMTDSGMPGTYAWLTYEPVQFSKWAGLRIQDGCAIERSTPNLPGAPFVDWATVSCDRTLGFVCEQVPPIIRPEDHHAYRPLYARVSWFDARDDCVRLGGHLVTIDDQAENDFVSTLTPGEFWIGAIESNDAGVDPADASCPTDAAIDSHYEWVTGGPVNATFFAPGEPDHADCARCLIMGGDKGWHDRACNQSIWYSPYVCETE
jgi:cysteine-rich repeat protein